MRGNGFPHFGLKVTCRGHLPMDMGSLDRLYYITFISHVASIIIVIIIIIIISIIIITISISINIIRKGTVRPHFDMFSCCKLVRVRAP